MGTTLFHTKAIEVEAVRFTLPFIDRDNQPAWLQDAFDCGKLYGAGSGDSYLAIEQGARKPALCVREGDWLIYLAGELFPCNPDLFAATFGRGRTG